MRTPGALRHLRQPYRVDDGFVEGDPVGAQQMRLDAVQDVVDHAAELGWRDTWRAESRLPGPAGNIEHFVLFERA